MKAREILTAPPEPDDEPDYMAPGAHPRLMTIQNQARLLEHKLVDTLMDILDNGTEKSRLVAVDKTADVLGKKSKANVLVTDNVNVQNNHFIEHFQKQALPAPLGDIDAHAQNMPTPLGEDEVDPLHADEIDEGDVQ